MNNSNKVHVGGKYKNTYNNYSSSTETDMTDDSITIGQINIPSEMFVQTKKEILSTASYSDMNYNQNMAAIKSSEKYGDDDYIIDYK